MTDKAENPLGTGKIGRLLTKFAVPSIIAMVVNALYNIVDQIFIGNGVGYLGNAATNVAFPFTTIALSFALLLGQGGASKQNLSLGANDRRTAEKAVGNVLFCLLICALVLFGGFRIFLDPLLLLFGATPDVFPYAHTYSSIILWGMPFVICSVAVNNIIRADGAPVYSMACMITGAVINTILDPIFILALNWGMAGAAWATVIGQVVSCCMSAAYLFRTKHITVRIKDMRPQGRLILKIAALGVASFFNQISLTIVQVVLNNTMTHYGELSEYGSNIPLACAGIMIKVNMIFMAVVIGIGQGSQPIVSFNYGAKSYARVMRTFLTAALAATAVAVLAFLGFQIFPRQIISLFGEGSEAYLRFSEKCFRIYLFFTFLNGIQPVTTVFLTSIGKGVKGMFIAVTRQLLFLVPMILIFGALWGIDGIMYAAPVSDAIAFALAVIFVAREFKDMDRKRLKVEA